MATYALIEDGFEYDKVEADSASEALDLADPGATGNYDTSDGTVWTTVYACKECDCCKHSKVTENECDECIATCSAPKEHHCSDCECPIHGDDGSCECAEDRESRTFQIDPDEPECSDGESHDWQSPYEILGGMEENPGVFGHGGGVIIREVCMHCGCERKTDTWAQNPSNGIQGLTSVAYEPGKYSEEVEPSEEVEQ